MRGIDKRFGTVQANDKVDLTLYPGEIHAVLGENGAGKTTLMNILSGMYQPDSGSITLDGNPVTIGSPSEALALGIGTVYQHFTLVPNLSVIENVMLGTKTGFVLNLSRGEQQLKELLAGFELNTDPQTEVRHLSIGQRQRVEIVKVLFRGTRVLLLDEPTSVLTPSEVDGLFRILRRLREEGVSVVIITHKLEEALDVSDRVTILRGGKNVGELGPAEIAAAGRAGARQQIVETMFGGMPAAAETFQQHVATGKTLLELRACFRHGRPGRDRDPQSLAPAARRGDLRHRRGRRQRAEGAGRDHRRATQDHQRPPGPRRNRLHQQGRRDPLQSGCRLYHRRPHGRRGGARYERGAERRAQDDQPRALLEGILPQPQGDRGERQHADRAVLGQDAERRYAASRSFPAATSRS